MDIEKFSREFTKEHQIIRDLLLGLITSIIRTDRQESKEKIGKLATITGPHFRYEEESLYPLLTRFYGRHYINKLFTDHDLAIARAFKIKEILDDHFDDKEKRKTAINHVRGLLPHVSDCQGLIIFAERMDDHEIGEIIRTMEKSRDENHDLLTWASNTRNRKLIRFQ